MGAIKKAEKSHFDSKLSCGNVGVEDLGAEETREFFVGLKGGTGKGNEPKIGP